jgi:type VI secretion system protein ImpL
MAPLIPADDSTAAGYDLAIEFRANAQGEAEGNKIIDWSIDIGGQQLGWRDTPRPLRWTPGQPITLTLRLAKDGPAVPRRNERLPALHVEERTVTLRYDDPWALLNLLLQHRDASGGTGARDVRSQLLRIEFPLTLLSEVPGTQAIETQARVYLRMTVSQAGKRSPLVWPGTLPVRAPEASLP